MMSKRSLSPISRRSSIKEDKYAKRSKEDEKPSPVIYVRNLPTNVTEADFHDALYKFGTISYVLCMRSKGQALVEFETLEAARNCIERSKRPIKIAGQTAVFEYSKSDFIRRSGLESQVASNILVVTVYNLQYPISSRHGRVLRIAMVKGKDNYEVQALVEFDNVASAKMAKKALNGADIYEGCCTLKVEFSKVQQVTVTKNTNERHDYTGRLDNVDTEPPFATSTQQQSQPTKQQLIYFPPLTGAKPAFCNCNLGGCNL